MDFRTFTPMLIERLGIEPLGELETWTGLYDDLGIDSFQVFEVLTIIETAAGLPVPPDETPDMFTLGDAAAGQQDSGEPPS